MFNSAKFHSCVCVVHAVQFPQQLCDVKSIQIRSSAETCNICIHGGGNNDINYLCMLRANVQAETRIHNNTTAGRLGEKDLYVDTGSNLKCLSDVGRGCKDINAKQGCRPQEIPGDAVSHSVSAEMSSHTENKMGEQDGQFKKSIMLTRQEHDLQEERIDLSCARDEDEQSCSEDSTDWVECLHQLNRSPRPNLDEDKKMMEARENNFHLVDTEEGTCHKNLSDPYPMRVGRGYKDDASLLTKGYQSGEYDHTNTRLFQDPCSSQVGIDGKKGRNEVECLNFIPQRSNPGGRQKTKESVQSVVRSNDDLGSSDLRCIDNEMEKDISSKLVGTVVEDNNALFEAELELQNQNLCSSMTIGLLSPTKNSCVVVEHILVTVSPGPTFLSGGLSDCVKLSQLASSGEDWSSSPRMLTSGSLPRAQGFPASATRNPSVSSFVSIDGLVLGSAHQHSISGPSVDQPIEELIVSMLPDCPEEHMVSAGLASSDVRQNSSAVDVWQRLDRLEAVCVRIETSLCKVLESFDRRLEILEARKILEVQPSLATFPESKGLESFDRQLELIEARKTMEVWPSPAAFPEAEGLESFNRRLALLEAGKIMRVQPSCATFPEAEGLEGQLSKQHAAFATYSSSHPPVLSTPPYRYGNCLNHESPLLGSFWSPYSSTTTLASPSADQSQLAKSQWSSPQQSTSSDGLLSSTPSLQVPPPSLSSSAQPFNHSFPLCSISAFTIPQELPTPQVPSPSHLEPLELRSPAQLRTTKLTKTSVPAIYQPLCSSSLPFSSNPVILPPMSGRLSSALPPLVSASSTISELLQSSFLTAAPETSSSLAHSTFDLSTSTATNTLSEGSIVQEFLAAIPSQQPTIDAAAASKESPKGVREQSNSSDNCSKDSTQQLRSLWLAPALPSVSVGQSSLTAFSRPFLSGCNGLQPGSNLCISNMPDKGSRVEAKIDEVSSNSIQQPLHGSDLISNRSCEGIPMIAKQGMWYREISDFGHEVSCDTILSREGKGASDMEIQGVNWSEEFAGHKEAGVLSPYQGVSSRHHEDTGFGQEEEILLRPRAVDLSYQCSNSLTNGSAMRDIGLAEPKKSYFPTSSDVLHGNGIASKTVGTKHALQKPVCKEDGGDFQNWYVQQKVVRSAISHVPNVSPRSQQYGMLPPTPSVTLVENTQQQSFSDFFDNDFSASPRNSLLVTCGNDTGTEGTWSTLSSTQRRGCPLQNDTVSREWFWASNASLMSTHLPAHRETIVEEDLTHHCARPSNEQEQGYWDSLKPHETISATSQVSSSVIPSATSSPFVAAGSVHGPVEDSFLHEVMHPHFLSTNSSPFVSPTSQFFAGERHSVIPQHSFTRQDPFEHFHACQAISPLACGHSMPMASSLQCDDSLFSLHSQFCNYQQQQQ